MKRLSNNKSLIKENDKVDRLNDYEIAKNLSERSKSSSLISLMTTKYLFLVTSFYSVFSVVAAITASIAGTGS